MSNWYVKIDKNFREQLTSFGESYSEIEKGCNLMDSTLKDLQKRTNKNYDYIHNSLEELIDHFDFCKDFATGKIPESEWEDYDFDGDLLEMFNNYMTEFWDLCDTRISPAMTYCWVGF